MTNEIPYKPTRRHILEKIYELEEGREVGMCV